MKTVIALVLVALVAVGGYFVWKLVLKAPPAALPPAAVVKTPVATPAGSVAASPVRLPQLAHDDDPIGTVRLEGQVIDADEKPVANADVGIDANPPKTIKTDAAGGFAFDGLLVREYEVSARADAGYAGPVRVRTTAKHEPVTLRLKPGATVEVLVTDGAAPIANATVELRATTVWTAKSDAKGVATLAHVGPVWAPLVASAPGYAPSAMMLGTSGETAQRVSLKLIKGSAVTGSVVDETGKPVAGARVVATNASEPFPVVDARRDGVETSTDGSFVLPAISPGTWRLTATHSTFAPATSAPISISGAKFGVKLVLVAGATVSGKVVDATGAPVASANVRVVVRGGVEWRSQRQAFSAGDGSFSIAGLPRRGVDVVAQSAVASSPIMPLELDKSQTITLTLGIVSSIEGTVVDSGGAPLGDAQVTAEPEPTGKPSDLSAWIVRGSQEVVTDQGGAFELAGLPDGNYRVRATRAGGDEALAPFVVAKPGGAALKIVVPNEGKLTGKVAFADGTVPVGFTVRLGNGYGTPFATADGTFTMSAIAGTHALVVEGQSFLGAKQKDVTVVEGKTVDVGTITVEKGRSVSGHVLDQRGAAVAGAKVAAGRLLTGGGSDLYIADESIDAKDATTDANGYYRIDGFSPGPITIVAGKDAGRSASQTVPPSSDSATIDLVLAATTGIDGKVVRDGKPVGDTVVIANPIGAASSNFFVVTGADGTFALDALAPGPYIIYPMIGGGGNKPKDLYIVKISVDAGTRTHVDLDATPGAGVVSLAVTSGGKPVAMGQVYLIGAPVKATVYEDLRALDQLNIFGPTAVVIQIRGVMNGAIDIDNVRAGDYTVCAAGMNGPPPSDLTKVPITCQPLKTTGGKQAAAIEVSSK